MAANGISTLQYKRSRQEAKLNLSSQKRILQQDSRPYFDINQLPSVYAPTSNNTNNVIDNPNFGGLDLGRPWIANSEVDYSLDFSDQNNSGYYMFVGSRVF
jgi:hypothetical protein